MSAIDIIDHEENNHSDLVVFEDGLFWMTVTESDLIYVYNNGFELQKTYTFSVSGEQSI